MWYGTKKAEESVQCKAHSLFFPPNSQTPVGFPLASSKHYYHFLAILTEIVYAYANVFVN